MEFRVRVAGQRDIPRGVAVLRGARVVTMKGTEVIANADVVIRDNRIAAVGARGQVSVPNDARVIDVSGRTIVPGFMDTHAHLRPSYEVHRGQIWFGRRASSIGRRRARSRCPCGLATSRPPTVEEGVNYDCE